MNDDEKTRKVTIKPGQEKALAALLAGKSVTEAAEAAGVTRQTCSKWLHKDAAFAAELENARAESWAAARAKLEAAQGQAVETLVGLLDEKTWSARLAAASKLLELLKGLPEPTRTTPRKIKNARELAEMRAKRAEDSEMLLASL